MCVYIYIWNCLFVAGYRITYFVAGSNPTHQCTWTHPDGAQLPHAWPAPILAWLNNHDHGSAQPSHPSRALRISGAPKLLSFQICR